MARRLHPTAADWMVIGITPALIVVLVGSLSFFLVEVLYHGPYTGRLHWIMGCFVVAAVLIGRISIEEGREKAALFGIALAFAMGLATLRLVSGVSPLITFGLLALIWWCADRLTWDCTVIDKHKDASGEGLLQTVGFDRPAKERPSGGTEPEGTTDRADTSSAPPKSLWQRFVEYRKRPHAPGVWVIYFSLAALPIFGLGQGFVSGTDLASRRFIFKLLFCYVGAALGLLVTTSFLGLRRYLRQRRLEMPAEMAVVWLAAGGGLILLILLACLILPRRNAEYSVSHISALATSRSDLSKSRWAFGRDGPGEKEGDRKANRKDGDAEAQGKNKRGSDKGKSEKQGKSKQGNGSEKSKQKSQESQGKQKGDSPQKQGEQSSQKKGEENAPDSKSDQQKEDEQGKRESESDQRKRPPQNAERQESQSQERQQSQSQPNRPQPNRPLPNPTSFLGRLGLGKLLQLIYWLIVIAVVGYFLWRYWQQVVRAVREFVQALREFWQRLFGGSVQHDEESEPEQLEVAPPPRPFAEFPDPFASGQSERWSPDELIRYSFEAFEAWGRERGCSRAPEQTPYEFAEMVTRQERGLGREAVRLAELYNWSAFARQQVPKSSVDHLRTFWLRLGTL